MRVRLPEYYLIQRHCKDNESPGRIVGDFLSKHEAEKRKAIMQERMPNYDFWVIHYSEWKGY